MVPASEKGHIDNVRLLLEHGVKDTDHINRLGYTALLEVAALTDSMQVYCDIARLLLQYGANTDIKDHDCLTVRGYAVRCGFKEMVTILHENRKRVTLSTAKSEPPRSLNDARKILSILLGSCWLFCETIYQSFLRSYTFGPNAWYNQLNK